MDVLLALVMILGIVGLGLAVCVGLPAAVAVSRGRSGGKWAAVGLLLGPLAVLVLYLIPDRRLKTAAA